MGCRYIEGLVFVWDIMGINMVSLGEVANLCLFLSLDS